MIVSPKFRGFICTTAHYEGCLHNVKNQIDYIKSQKKIEGPKKVLVIGASTGYGLASRIATTFSSGASTIGVSFERPASGNRTATAGWYNTVAFEKFATEEGFYAKSLNGDAFSNELKEQTIALIKKDLGQVDLVVYSLASPRRVHPDSGEIFNSVLKPIGNSYTNKTVDFHNGHVTDISIEPANEDEMFQTIQVMGGEDWEMWISELEKAGALAPNAKTVAYSYVGPDITQPIYRQGTIGGAKDHLEATAKKMNEKLAITGGAAYVSINKALVTQASSAIPVVPLYVSILYKIMKEKGIHEGCIEQMYRLFDDRIYSGDAKLDKNGRIRIDDWEMRADIQAEVSKLWNEINSENIYEISDLVGYRNEFFKLFGFGFEDVDYNNDVEIEKNIPSIE